MNEIDIGTRGLTLMLTSNIAGVENGVNKETKFHYKICLRLSVSVCFIPPEENSFLEPDWLICLITYT